MSRRITPCLAFFGLFGGRILRKADAKRQHKHRQKAQNEISAFSHQSILSDVTFH
tara:strand:- start:346 stop:510 length:165 start_codon:yes stop_codon:yes gene_type:complete